MLLRAEGMSHRQQPVALAVARALDVDRIELGNAGEEGLADVDEVDLVKGDRVLSAHQHPSGDEEPVLGAGDAEVVVAGQVSQEADSPADGQQGGDEEGHRGDAHRHQLGHMGQGAVEHIGDLLAEDVAQLGDEGGAEQHPGEVVGGDEGEDDHVEVAAHKNLAVAHVLQPLADAGRPQ